MTEEERARLAIAEGSANAALNLCRMLTQMLVENGIIDRGHMLEALDMTVLSVEEMLKDPRAGLELDIQHRQLQSAHAELASLPLMPGEKADGSS